MQFDTYTRFHTHNLKYNLRNFDIHGSMHQDIVN
jgi:hypothetical protein